MARRKRKVCTQCKGTKVWKGITHTGTCFACNGKGWQTPQNVINWAAAQRAKAAKVHKPPVQYKD